MNLLHFTGIRLTMFLVTGIGFGFYTETGWQLPLFLSLILLGLLGGLSRLKNEKYNRFLFGSLVFLTVFATGWLTFSLHQQKNHPHHYIRSMKPDEENEISFRIRSLLKPNPFYDRYEVEIFSLNRTEVSGKALLLLRKDSSAAPVKVDERYRVKTRLREVRPPQNPHQFNYKAYLEKQHIYHQLFIAPEALYPLPDADLPSLYGLAADLRDKLGKALVKHGFQGDELAVINALLLGERRELSEEVHTRYARAGAIHILAVSGLHVGIILLIFNGLLRPLERLPHGKTWKLLLLLLLLWAFALVAGLSASVVRAVTMFSFVAWALHLKRSVNIYNTLALSVFFLLLIRPSFLFEVGFQLSYSAVFAIIWLQPLLYNRWKPSHRITNFFWKLLTVTLAAQCGVAPLSLYYFHQFPGLFFVSNLVIIPVLGFILGSGLFVMVLAVTDLLPRFLGLTYEKVIKLMNDFIAWVARQEDFLFTGIPFDAPLMMAVYLALITGILMLKKPAFSRMVAFLIAAGILQGIFLLNKYNTGHIDRLIVFHKNRSTLIGEQRGATMIHYAPAEKSATDNAINNYAVAERVRTAKREALRNIYVMGEKTLLRIDSLGIYAVPGLQPDYVLLCESPRINPERLITELRPVLIIADGSNYKSFIERWKATCKKYNVPFHVTGEKGAFIAQ